MPLPTSFQKAMDNFTDPWKTLVQIMGQELDRSDQEGFSNFRILGENSGDEKVTINAWTLVGLAPGHRNFLECHCAAGEEKDKPFWIRELRDAVAVLQLPANPTPKRMMKIMGGMTHASLGLNQHHVIGIISLHQTEQSKKSFAILWVNPRVDRILVEEILKHVLEERLT